jgi:hypothetical protein
MKQFLMMIALVVAAMPLAVKAETLVDLDFPVQGEATYINDFLQGRSGGRVHHATDIMAAKMTPVVAAVDGVITFAPNPEPYYGFMLTLKGDDGYTYNYIHLNDDTPGTDDGRGGVAHAYAPGIARGVRVVRGQHIGWVGDSGNAESTPAHLHFEIYRSGTAINPYASLVAAQADATASELAAAATVTFGELSYNPAEATKLAVTISADNDLVPAHEGSACEAHTLFRTTDNPAVYYCGVDGERYVFHNESTFLSWYGDFKGVETISAPEVAAIPFGGVVTYKPGAYLVKALSSPDVYAVGHAGALHHVPSADMATALYGADWVSDVRDIPDSLFASYHRVDSVTEL